MKKTIKMLLITILTVTICLTAVCLTACITTDKSNLTATFDDNHIVYEGDSLDSLKPYLTVKYTDKEGNTITITDYTIIGTLDGSTDYIKVSYNGLSYNVYLKITRKYLHTVALDYNGATNGNTLESIIVTYGQPIGTLPTPSKTGYEFIGWKYGEDIVDNDFYWYTNGNATFVAQWRRTVADFEYKLNSDNNTYAVASVLMGTDYDVIIPSTYDGKPVTSIDYRALENANIVSVTIPDSIKSIGNDAFYGCSSLANVNYLGTIESWCNIQGLDNLMDSGYNSTNSKTFSLNGEPVTELVIPGTVTSIPSYAFYKCTNITSVTIGNSVISIDSSAFGNCYSLTGITIPDSVTGIGNFAFDGCSNLQYNEYDNAYYLGNDTNKYVALIKAKDTSITSCTINRNTNVIYNGAFHNCSNLESITIPFVGASKNDTENTHFSYIFGASSNEYNEYYVPTTLKTVVITSGTSIAPSAFDGCNSLTSITIPDSVISIGYGSGYTSSTFYGCNQLANINYLGTIESWCKIKGLEYLMGYDTSSSKMLNINGEPIAELVIPNTVTSIPPYAFCNCKNITSVTIDNNDTSISSSAFYGCNNIKKAKISTTAIRSIPKTNLQTVIITGGDSIGSSSAFDGCSSLTSIIISNSVTNIGHQAFYNCSSLTSITIPDSVTSIGYQAFTDCSKLTTITFKGTVEQWNNITKGDYWKDSVPATKVICSDGEVAI